MEEGWATLTSYRLHDLLMFSADTYFRLFEWMNRRWWPAPVVGALLSMLVLGAAVCRRASLFALGLLALAWTSAALFYFRDGFAGIHWLGLWWMGAFLLQALLWLVWATAARPVFTAQALGRAPGLMLVLAAVAWPALTLALQHPPWQAEVVGLAPEPTVLLSLGLLLTLQPTRRWAAGLLVVPLAWCVFSGATLSAMEQPHAWVLPLAGSIAGMALLLLRR
jgi:hypothetical protein